MIFGKVNGVTVGGVIDVVQTCYEILPSFHLL